MEAMEPAASTTAPRESEVDLEIRSRFRHLFDVWDKDTFGTPRQEQPSIQKGTVRTWNNLR